MEAVYKSGGPARQADAQGLVLDQPSIVFLKVAPESVARYERRGGDLVLVLRDGKEIAVPGFFAEYPDGGRNDLVLEDDTGVLWWGQYTQPWSDFQFTEIEWTDPVAGLLPDGVPGWLLGALGVLGVAAAAGGGGGGGGGGAFLPPLPAQNRAPEGEADAVRTPQDRPVAGQVQGIDADGDALTYTVAKPPEHGTVVIDPATGRYTYTPAPGYEGPDSFEVTVSDGRGGSTTVTVPVTVTPVNDAPEAPDQAVSTAEDTLISGRVEGHDQDGDTLTYTQGSGPSHGTVVVNEDGSYTYTPDPDFNGTDSFTVIVDDGNGSTTTSTVTVTVTPVNDVPVPVDPNEGLPPTDPGYIPGQSFDPETGDYELTTPEDTPIDGRVTGTDADGDTLTYTPGPNGPANGTVTIDPVTGEYTYTPNPDYNGPDSFDVVISDGNGGTTTSTVTITVTPVNDVPVPVDPNEGLPPTDPGYIPGQSFDPVTGDYELTTPEDTPIDGRVTGTDADGDTLTYTAGPNGPSNGTVTIDPVTGEYTYTPNPDYNGPDSFDVVISDGNGGTTTSTVTITVTPVNDVPVPVDPNEGLPPTDPGYIPGQSFDPVTGDYELTTPEDTPIDGRVTGTDADGDMLTYTPGPNGPSNGTVTIDPVTGEYTYTPNPDYNGPDSFDVVISDGNGGTVTSTVTITVTPVNDPPVFVDPGDPGTPGNPNPPTDPGNPGAPAYRFEYDEGRADDDVLGTVQALDADASSTITYTIVGGDPNGWFEIDASGNISLTPAGVAAAANDFETPANEHTLTVRASDGDSNTDITVTLAERDVNDNVPVFVDPGDPGTPGNPNPPTDPGNPGAPAYRFEYDEGRADDDVLGTVQALDADASSTITYTIVGGDPNGWFEIDASGNISLTPAGVAAAANDFETPANEHTLTVRASDGANHADITVTLAERDLNDSAPEFVDPNNPGTPGSPNPPVDPSDPGGAPAYRFSYDEDSPAGHVLGTVRALDADAGANVTYSIDPASDPNGWYAIDAATGEITLTAAGAASLANDFEAGANSHPITVVASDGTNTTSITVTLDEQDVNDSAPVIADGTATLYEEGLPGGVPADSTNPGVTTHSGQIGITDADTVGGPLTVTLSGPSGLTSGGEPVTWAGDGTAGSPLIGTAGGEEVLRAVIDSDGNYTVTLSKPLDHPLAGGENALDVDLTVSASDGVHTGTGTLTVTVQDDAPVANPGAVSIELPEQDSNLLLVLDISGSMATVDAGSGGKSRMEIMKEAVNLMLDQYDALGDVAVRIVTFGSGASAYQSTWISVSDAKTYVESLSANSGATHYSTALTTAEAAWAASGKIDGASNIAYFLTDGAPTGGYGITEARENTWTSFLDANDINAFAYGMGPAAPQGPIDPAAYDGRSGTNTDAIVVADTAQLPPILRDSVVAGTTGTVVDVGGALGGDSHIGADGGGVDSIVVNGRTYHADGTVTDAGGAPVGPEARSNWNAADHVWTIDTELGGDVSKGGRLVINMDTGEYSYTPPIIATGNHQENIGFTLIDSDGDTASSTLTITVNPAGSTGGAGLFAAGLDEGGAGVLSAGDSLGLEAIGHGAPTGTAEEAGTRHMPALSELFGDRADGSLDALFAASPKGTFIAASSGPTDAHGAETALHAPLPASPLDDPLHHQAVLHA